MSDPQRPPLPLATEVHALLAKVVHAKAKPEDLAAFRSLLDRQPGIVDTLLNLTDQTFEAILKPLAGDSPGALEILQRVRRAKQAELGFQAAPPLEKLLIEAVVLAWVAYTNTERHAASVWNGSHTLSVGEYWDKRVSAAQRRYLRAVETLARVRRLQLPAVQVNIAEQQINQVNASGTLTTG